MKIQESLPFRSARSFWGLAANWDMGLAGWNKKKKTPLVSFPKIRLFHTQQMSLKHTFEGCVAFFFDVSTVSKV